MSLQTKHSSSALSSVHTSKLSEPDNVGPKLSIESSDVRSLYDLVRALHRFGSKQRSNGVCPMKNKHCYNSKQKAYNKQIKYSKKL